ncbi:hypothetical protein BDV11DRAFT_122267 [Aspergillus similis]
MRILMLWSISCGLRSLLFRLHAVAKVKEILASWREILGGRRDLSQTANFQLSRSARGPQSPPFRVVTRYCTGKACDQLFLVGASRSLSRSSFCHPLTPDKAVNSHDDKLFIM